MVGKKKDLLKRIIYILEGYVCRDKLDIFKYVVINIDENWIVKIRLFLKIVRIILFFIIRCKVCK